MSGELPEGWRHAKLGEVAALSGGTTPSKTNDAYWLEGTMPWATPSDITSLPLGQSRIDATEAHIAEVALKECSLKLNSPGTVLMTSRATIGYAAINDVPMATNQGFLNFTCLDGCDPEFLCHWLNANRGLLTAAAGGSTFKELSRGTAKLLPILLPPFNEQRRIAEVLRSADDAIAANQRATRQSDMTLKMSMDAALHITSRAPPSHWRNVQIRELGKVQAGRQRAPSFTLGEVRPYLRVANVFDGYIDVSDVLTMPFTDREFSEYRLLPGDILINEGQSLHLVGRAAIYEGQPEECCFQNTLVRFRAEVVSPMFAYALTRTLYWTGQLSAIATQTTSVAHLGVSRFANLRVALPPKDEQEQIANAFLALSSASESLKAAGVRLSELRSALVADLLSGRVRVSA